jgi:hypothetical protein
MRTRQYICISLINLGFLVTGIALDRMFLLEETVYAQAQAATSVTPDYEEITPTMTVGSAGIGTLLVNRIAADQLTVNGYDVLKLDEGIMQLIRQKTLTQSSELDALVATAKVSRPLRMKLPAPPAPKGGTVVK